MRCLVAAALAFALARMWSIEIRPRGTPDHLVKVEVDAATGAILKVKDVKGR